MEIGNVDSESDSDVRQVSSDLKELDIEEELRKLERCPSSAETSDSREDSDFVIITDELKDILPEVPSERESDLPTQPEDSVLTSTRETSRVRTTSIMASPVPAGTSTTLPVPAITKTTTSASTKVIVPVPAGTQTSAPVSTGTNTTSPVSAGSQITMPVPNDETSLPAGQDNDEDSQPHKKRKLHKKSYRSSDEVRARYITLAKEQSDLVRIQKQIMLKNHEMSTRKYNCEYKRIKRKHELESEKLGLEIKWLKKKLGIVD